MEVFSFLPLIQQNNTKLKMLHAFQLFKSYIINLTIFLDGGEEEGDDDDESGDGEEGENGEAAAENGEKEKNGEEAADDKDEKAESDVEGGEKEGEDKSAQVHYSVDIITIFPMGTEWMVTGFGLQDAEEEDDPSNLQLAWEMLELAKVDKITSRRLVTKV